MHWKGFKVGLFSVAAFVFLVVVFFVTLFAATQSKKNYTIKSKAFEPEPTRQLPNETTGESFLPDIIGGTLMGAELGNSGMIPNEASVPITNVQMQLWQDTDDNGVYRTIGDKLLETTVTDEYGRWRFTNIPNEEEHIVGVVIDNLSVSDAVSIIEGETYTVGGILYTDLGYARGISVLSWRDTGSDGYYGNEGDMLAGMTKSKKGGIWSLELPGEYLDGAMIVNSWGVK